MRTVAEYLAKAAEFDDLALRSDAHPALKKRYADLAACYRVLANEREKLIAEGELSPDSAPN